MSTEQLGTLIILGYCLAAPVGVYIWVKLAAYEHRKFYEQVRRYHDQQQELEQ